MAASKDKVTKLPTVEERKAALATPTDKPKATEIKKTTETKKAAPKKVKKPAAKAKTVKKPAAKVTTKPKTVKAKATKAKTVSKPKTSKVSAKTAAKKTVSKTKKSTKTKPVNQTIKLMETIMTAKPYDFDKLTKDATASSQELFGAFQKSMNIWVKGVEKINQETVSLAQDIANKNQEAFKALIECKDVNELADVQNKLAQKHFDTIVASATKLSEISVKVATDSFEPINDQVNKAVKKATDSVAA